MNDKKTIAAYLAVCLFWGSTFLAIRIGVKDLPPFKFAAMRFLMAGGVMVVFGLLTKKTFPRSIKEYTQIIFTGVVILLGGNGLVTYAEQWIHSGVACLMVTTIPLIMVFIESVILKQVRVNWKGMIGFLVSFMGVAILTLAGGEVLSVDAFGIGLLLLAALFWASGSVYSKNINYTSDMVPRIGIQMLGGFIGLFTMSVITGETLILTFTKNSFLALSYLIIFGSIVGYSCYIYILDKWPASKASTYAYVNPVVAVILGALILKEPLTLEVILSMVVIISGVMIVQRVGVEEI